MLSLLFHSQMLAIHTYYVLVLTKILARQASLFLFHRWSNWRCGRGRGWLKLTEHEQRKDRNCRAYSNFHTLQQGREIAHTNQFYPRQSPPWIFFHLPAARACTLARVPWLSLPGFSTQKDVPGPLNTPALRLLKQTSRSIPAEPP